ncbi:ECs_2282 family putative zinc-binding protein [Pseudomonas fluorescens]|uniref:ECs_2282 family putative zinc-binding protein n=1 Tax=Pseudomonas fluorescens TaxID=294 RepID=UPI001253A2AB|nr:hypothetical protein [Pseudomonas fluorescens]VVO05987.1 hypothetical protein PS720_03036 [Pseudomonas fluorescens]
MNSEKYQRSVEALCPTCGSSLFVHEAVDGDTMEVTKCASCSRQLTKDELLHENVENLEANAREMALAASKDIADELRNSLRRALSGNKNIRLK